MREGEDTGITNGDKLLTAAFSSCYIVISIKRARGSRNSDCGNAFSLVLLLLHALLRAPSRVTTSCYFRMTRNLAVSYRLVFQLDVGNGGSFLFSRWVRALFQRQLPGLHHQRLQRSSIDIAPTCKILYSLDVYTKYTN